MCIPVMIIMFLYCMGEEKLCVETFLQLFKNVVAPSKPRSAQLMEKPGPHEHASIFRVPAHTECYTDTVHFVNLLKLFLTTLTL